jgi:hypothetical protein
VDDDATRGGEAVTEAQASGATSNRRNRNRNLGSTLIFAALAVVLVAIAIVYTRNDDDPPPTAPIPTAVGHNELINVQQALAAQDLDVEIGQGTASAREAGINQPGQILTIGDATVYVFIFEDVAQREATSAAIDPATLVLKSPSGRPLAGPGTDQPDIRLAQQSNVIAVLAGGDEALATQFDAAIASLQ